jgi:hypothetical protein
VTKKPGTIAIMAVLLVIAAAIGGGYLLLKMRSEGNDGDLPDDDDNSAPTALAGYDRTVGPGDEVTLDGSLSTDPDGDIMTYSWDVDDSIDSDSDGDPANDADLVGEVARYIYPLPEATVTYRAVLNVSDGKESDTDTVQVTVLISEDKTAPIINITCHYTRPPTPIPGVTAQYMLTIDSVSRVEMLLNYSYRLIDPDNDPIQEGGLIDLLTAPPNATLRYLDKNPRYQDCSAGDSIAVKDVPSIPEGSVLEIYFRSFPDPSGAVGLTKGVQK